MKRLALLLVTTTILFSPIAEAQTSGVELTIFGGYRSGGDFNPIDAFDDLFQPDLEVDDGDVLGAALGIPIADNLAIELLYSRQESELFFNGGFFAPRERISDVDVTYAQVGIQYQWTPGQLRPFVGAGLGIARLDPQGSSLESEDAFAGNINGGLKIFPTEHVGLRLDGRVYFANFDNFRGDRCEFCEDYGDGDLYQGEATVGIIFKF